VYRSTAHDSAKPGRRHVDGSAEDDECVDVARAHLVVDDLDRVHIVRDTTTGNVVDRVVAGG
jgi:hypothetical protein